MSTKSSLQLRPPRERGMGRAFGLAVSLHVVLLALLFAGTRGQQTASAGPHTAVSGLVTPLPLAVPVPRMVKRDWASRLTVPARLVAANNQTPLTRHSNETVKPKQRRGLDSQIARAGATLRAPLTEELSVAQQRNRSVDRERAARLAALQAIAGRPLPDSGEVASAAYASRVARRVRANVLAPFDIEGNPSAVIAVTCTPSGALLSVTVQRSSGDPRWDRAVVAAVENSDPMPADLNGNTPTSFVMTFRPKG
ncbi:energy transducer TonB [Paraburkholderia sp. A3BS-1L]|uniref:energy transducer TonB n=1 Tax=Paraburkholderia sp. A3BS-1L TaxID=3028375 RepID=UPI003DA8AA54